MAIRKINYREFLKLAKPKNYIVLFTGGDDPITKKNWCSYCIDSKPAIYKNYMPTAEERGISKTHSPFVNGEGLRGVWGTII